MTMGPRGEDTRSAAEWFAVMHGPSADKERAAFEAWLAVPANAEAHARLEATWAESRFLANSLVGRDRDLSRARRKRPPAALLAAGIAAFALVSAGLVAGQAGWFGPPAAEAPAAHYVAGKTVRSIRLADGSRVTLDEGAALRELEDAGERRFLLLRGRARFEVAHDAARPFIVEAGEGRVIAHGTVFDVAIEGKMVRVALVDGSVEVRGLPAQRLGRDPARFLSPGEQLLVGDGQVGAPSPANPAALSWAATMISFEDIPLGEAIAAFNRSGGRPVRLADQATKSRGLSGAFRRDDPRAFANALAASFGLEVMEETDGSLVLRAPATEAPAKKSQG